MSQEKIYSYLDLVKACDSFPYDKNINEVYKLLIGQDERPHGYMLPEIVKKMPWTENFVVNHHEQTVRLSKTPSNAHDFSKYCNDAFANVINAAISQDVFSTFHGEHSEPYFIPGLKDVHLERYAAPLFGTVSQGAHLTVFTRTKNSSGQEELKIWVAKRSAHLFTYPNKYDTTVAGGIRWPDSPFETIVHEADEEASLDSGLIRSGIRAVGAITYIKTSGSGSGGERGLISPDLVYLYDLEVGEDVVPKPRDDEVEGFYLWSVDEVKRMLVRGQFKSNSAVIMIEFFIRHGIITEENEKDYAEILMRMHRRIPFPTSPGN